MQRPSIPGPGAGRTDQDRAFFQAVAHARLGNRKVDADEAAYLKSMAIQMGRLDLARYVHGYFTIYRPKHTDDPPDIIRVRLKSVNGVRPRRLRIHDPFHPSRKTG